MSIPVSNVPITFLGSEAAQVTNKHSFSWESKSNTNHGKDGRFEGDGGSHEEEEPDVSPEDLAAFGKHDDAYEKHVQSIQDLHDEMRGHMAKMEALKTKLGKVNSKAGEHFDALNSIREKYGMDALEKEGSIFEHGEEIHDAVSEAVKGLKGVIGDAYGSSKFLALPAALDFAVKGLSGGKLLQSRAALLKRPKKAADKK